MMNFGGALANPLDVLSFVCANICTSLNSSQKHPRNPKHSETSRDRRELVLYCHERLEKFYDEEDETRDSKVGRNYQAERGFKLATVTPPQRPVGLMQTAQMPQNSFVDRKRKMCLRDEECQNEGPARKMTRNNRGNLYKQIIREEIFH